MINRREFLQKVLAVLGGTALASFLYPLYQFFLPQVEESDKKQIVLSTKDVPAGDAKEFVFHNTPGVIINRADKGFVALSRVCTHLGCLVEFQKDSKRLLCPCHAGTYDFSGAVLSGPPPKPLQQFPLKVVGDSIIIG